MRIRKEVKKYVFDTEKHEDLIFVCDDPEVLADFWDAIAPELPEGIDEFLIPICQAIGFHITMIDTGEWYLKWRVSKV